MNKCRYIIIVAILGGLSSCKSTYKSTQADDPNDEHSSRYSLDWQGTYLGVLPCADCKGIKKTISLDSNFNYHLEIRYLGRADTTITIDGRFRWNSLGNTIILHEIDDEAVAYFVAENSLAQLDEKGNRITGSLAPDYILSKERYAILNKNWKLTELNGKSVVFDSSLKKIPFIQFDEMIRFSGFGGCNYFSGTYQISGTNSISFSQSISTMMACSSIDVESKFFQALESADYYSVTGNELLISKARIVTLARFKTPVLNDDERKEEDRRLK